MRPEPWIGVDLRTRGPKRPRYLPSASLVDKGASAGLCQLGLYYTKALGPWGVSITILDCRAGIPETEMSWGYRRIRGIL